MLRPAAWGLAIGWTLLIGTSLWLTVRSHYSEAEDYARAEAEASYQKDLLYRRWVSAQGGVYAEPTAATPPNPHLAHLPERDVATTTGKPLTLINPAYMTRMVHELGQQQYGVQGHITSLNPLRPENAPDEWEAEGLRAFDHGAREALAVVTYKGEPALRLIRPFVTEASCLKCHAHQGYRVGDIRGGISTTVPLTRYYATAAQETRESIASHGLVLILGLCGIGLGHRQLSRALTARDSAHNTLRESERRQRQMVERLPLVAVTCTLDGSITYCNPALLAIAGRPLAATIGCNFFELFVPHAQRSATEAEFRSLIARGAEASNSVGIIAAHDGTPRTISWLHTMVTDAGGQPVGVSSLGEDITTRAAEDLQMRLLSRAVEQSSASVVITDREGRIEYVNHRFTVVTGYPAAEVLGQNPRILSAGEEPKEFYREMWDNLIAGRDWRGVFHNRRRNGEHFWEEALISPVRDATGAIVRFLAIKEDITEQRRTAQALAESEQRFRTLIEHAPVAVVVHRETRCIYANPAALQLFGYEPSADPAGIDIRMHIQPASIAVVREREKQATAGKVNPSVELELLRCDGTRLTCESIATRVTYNNQPVTLALIVDISERRQMLAALEESEARYRTLVDAAPVAIFSLANGRFAFANPAAAHLFGFANPAELVGTSLWQHVHADSLSAVTNLLTQAEAGRETPHMELTFLRRDRTNVLCNTVGVPLDLGRQSTVLVLASDITEHKQLEDALRENEARMRETLESTNAGYFLLDQQDRIIQANSAFLGFAGQVSLAAVRGRTLPEVLPESARDAAHEGLQRLACGEEFVGGEFVARHADGTARYFNYTAHIVRESDRIAGCEGFVLDTTEARTSEERYQMIFERMLDGFALHEILCDPAGRPVDYRYLAVNPALEEIIGQPASAVIGRRVREVFPELEEKWVERYGRVALGGEPLRIEDYSAELGRFFEIVAFRTSPGRFVTLVRDVTEKRHLELQLQQAQKMEAVGQLAGGVAHDYNNILVAILMNLSMLRTESNLSPEVAGSLRELEHEAKRAANLTRQLLVFSRRQAAQPVPLDFNTQLEQMLAMLRRLLGENITIATNLTPDLPQLLADPGMLDQVVMNLCVNARDAMSTGGQIELTTARADFAAAPTAQHPEARPGSYLCFTVRDTGTGMDAATRSHIFEPFFTTKEAGKGTGLGLATVFGIVKQHGGWIEVDTAPGRGSSFRIFLPFAPALPADPAPAATPASPAAGGSETILLVEDDTVARQTMSLTLRRDGYDVLEAANVNGALSVWNAQRSRIAAVITDVVMPGPRNGLELAQIVHAENPQLSIIIISGYSDDATRTTAVVEGATYLAKPFDYETLTRALRTSLARRHPRA